MKVNFKQLIDDFTNHANCSDDLADERLSLIRELQQKTLTDPKSELADDQVIISSKYSTAVIDDVFFAIYKKLPRKIITASEKSKIVSFV